VTEKEKGNKSSSFLIPEDGKNFARVTGLHLPRLRIQMRFTPFVYLTPCNMITAAIFKKARVNLFGTVSCAFQMLH
jgi:hypothetical protein